MVVRPTNTGSVPRGTAESGPTPSSVSASYQGPHEPSAFLARTFAEVPVRSSAVSATIENGVSWWTSRIVSPPPRPVSGCCASCGARLAGLSLSSPGSPLIAHGSITTVAAIAVNNIDGAGRRHGTDRCYVCVSCYQCSDTVVGPTKCRAGRPATAPQSTRAFLRCRLVTGPRCPERVGQPGARARRRERRGRGRDGRGGAAAASAAGAPAGLTADMIAGINIPLSRSIAWPAPSCWRRWSGRRAARRCRWWPGPPPATDHRGSGRCPQRDPARWAPRSAPRPGRAGPPRGDRRSERRVGDRRRRGQAWKRRRSLREAHRPGW